MEKLSHTEEDYLKAIFRLTERSRGLASTNDIAKVMRTSAASVSDMIQRLARKEFFIYEKYHGVQLSSKGKTYAADLIRREGLWKVFLHKTLSIPWDRISSISEQLKHVRSEEMIQALDAHLGAPKFDPHGEAIPNAEGRFTLRNQNSLQLLNISDKARLVAVRNHDSEFLSYLSSLNLYIGAEIEVHQCFDFDHSKEIIIDKMHKCVLTPKVCQELYVKPIH